MADAVPRNAAANGSAPPGGKGTGRWTYVQDKAWDPEPRPPVELHSQQTEPYELSAHSRGEAR